MCNICIFLFIYRGICQKSGYSGYTTRKCPIIKALGVTNGVVTGWLQWLQWLQNKLHSFKDALIVLNCFSVQKY